MITIYIKRHNFRQVSASLFCTSSRLQTQDFKAAISNKICVVDFFADWCGPCKSIAPEIKKLAEKYANVKFIKVNVDELEELSEEYEITSLPTFKFFVNGAVKDTVVGGKVGPVESALAKLL